VVLDRPPPPLQAGAGRHARRRRRPPAADRADADHALRRLHPVGRAHAHRLRGDHRLPRGPAVHARDAGRPARAARRAGARPQAADATMAGMADAPVNLSPGGPPETVLDGEPAEALAALDEALGRPEGERRAAVAAVARRWPRFLDAWAQLARLSDDDVERYAYSRVGYHRGLDRLRANGWRGSGYVRWRHPQNRGFLRALDGLRAAAAAIGEEDEAARCEQFLRQLDPDWPPADL